MLKILYQEIRMLWHLMKTSNSVSKNDILFKYTQHCTASWGTILQALIFKIVVSTYVQYNIIFNSKTIN